MQKRFAMAAMLAASLAHAADNSELAAIRAQIDDMKRAYEQRIAALEQKLSQAEAKSAAPAPVAATPVAERRSRRQQRERLQPRGIADPAGQYKNMKDGRARYYRFLPAGGHDHEGKHRGDQQARFSVIHTELVLAANIDPYWRGQAIIATLDGTGRGRGGLVPVARLGLGQASA